MNTCIVLISPDSSSDHVTLRPTVLGSNSKQTQNITVIFYKALFEPTQFAI